MNDLFDLSRRTALVTGGGGLLGPEHAKALSKAGSFVYLADLNHQRAQDACNQLKDEGFNNIYAHQLDVCSREQWVEVVDMIVTERGQLDILVNNAGFTNQSKSANFDADFEDFPLEDWNSILDVNLTGSFLGCQVAGKEMLKKEKGAIINIASLYGVVSPNHNMYPGTGIKQPVAYSVSKHGVVALTKYVATLWASKGIRVNSLTPGGIFNGHEDPFLERFRNLNPIGRMSRKDELQGAINFLASDASSHVIGHNLIVDGGWTIW